MGRKTPNLAISADDFPRFQKCNFFLQLFAKFRKNANFRKNLAISWPFGQPSKIGPALGGLGPKTRSRAGFGFRGLNRPNLGRGRPKNRIGGFAKKWPTDRLIKILWKSLPFRPAGRPLLRTRFCGTLLFCDFGTQKQKWAEKRRIWPFRPMIFSVFKNATLFCNFLRNFEKLWPFPGHLPNLPKSALLWGD